MGRFLTNTRPVVIAALEIVCWTTCCGSARISTTGTKDSAEEMAGVMLGGRASALSAAKLSAADMTMMVEGENGGESRTLFVVALSWLCRLVAGGILPSLPIGG